MCGLKTKLAYSHSGCLQPTWYALLQQANNTPTFVNPIVPALTILQDGA